MGQQIKGMLSFKRGFGMTVRFSYYSFSHFSTLRKHPNIEMLVLGKGI